MTRFPTVLLILGGFAWMFAQHAPQNRGPLSRRYQEGEKLTYRMKGANEGQRYEIRATGIVKIDSAGKYIEEYAWSDLIVNGGAFPLPPASLRFRQILSLDPDNPPSIPNLGGVHPVLIGPITDLLTFYADLWLAGRMGKLMHAGDRLHHEHGTPASWADGNYVLLGQDSIDFDITLMDINQSNDVATLAVRHVPPKQPQVKLPADWMREPVADTPNNWVNVSKKGNLYVAAVGKETFDVDMKVSLANGSILSGTMENSVKARERDCIDAVLTRCGDSRPRQILRQLEISLER